MHLRSWTPETLTYEQAYNTWALRLFPWEGVEKPGWSGAWVVVMAGETTTPHAHEEKEIFFIVEGSGIIRIGEQETRVSFGDSVFIDPRQEHCIINDSSEARLLFLSVWWKERAASPVASVEMT